MTQTFPIAKAISSLSLVEDKFGLVESSDEQFFSEWFENLPQLNDSQKQALDRLKQRFLASDSFSLLSRQNKQNKLYNVLQILKRIGDDLGN